MSDLTVVSPLGAITISRALVAGIVEETAASCYGVVGLTPGSRRRKLLRRAGVEVGGDATGVRVALRVVVEYGLNLTEVASTVRSHVAYDVERLTGLPVAAVEVYVEDVRASA